MRVVRGVPGVIGVTLAVALVLPVAAAASAPSVAPSVAPAVSPGPRWATAARADVAPHRVVHLDQDLAEARAGVPARAARSWPGSRIRYWADLPASYDWSLHAALTAWNATGMDMTFVRAPKAKARLRIIIGDTHGADGYATVGYQRTNWVHLRKGLVTPVFGEPAPYAKVVAAHIIAHELGHVLGLGHTSGCELMTPVLELPTCSILADRIGYYSRIVDLAALKKTVARYGGRAALAPKASPIDPLPPRLGGVTFSGGLAQEAPVGLSWSPPSHAPSGSHVLLLVTNGKTCTYPTSKDYWGTVGYDSSKFQVIRELDPQKGSVTPSALGITSHCYALELVNRTGAGSAPQGKVLQSWVPAPAPPTVVSVRRTFDQSDPGWYKVLLDFDDAHGEQVLELSGPGGQCVTSWPAGTPYQNHVLGALPGEPVLMYAQDSGGQPIANACLTFFAMRADGARISGPVTYQVDAEPVPDAPVIDAVTRDGPDSYSVQATLDRDVAELAVVVRPENQCVTSWPGGDPMSSLVLGDIDTTGTTRPCLSFFAVTYAGQTNPTAVSRQMTDAPLPSKPGVSGVQIDEVGDVSGYTTLDPNGPFGLAMTVDPTGSCQPFPSGAAPWDYAVYPYDDGTGTAFLGYSADIHPCLTFYAYNWDGVLSAGTPVQL